MAVRATSTTVPFIAVLAPRAAHDEIARQLDRSMRLEWFETTARLLERLSAERPDAVILGLVDDAGRSIAASVVEIAARDRSVSFLLYDRIDGATLGSLLAVFGVGLRIECVVRFHDRVDAVLRRTVTPEYRPGVGPLLFHRFVTRAPKPLRVFVALAALSATDRHGAHEIARRCGVSLRTIERRLVRAGWPAAHVVIQSFVALDAVWLMTEYGWSARRVQAVRRFPHPSSVTRLLDRYAGVRPATVHEDGGFPAVLEFVTRALSPRLS